MKTATIFKRVKYLLILSALVFSYIFIFRMYSNELERMQNNVMQAMHQNNSIMLKLTKNEFKELKKNDSAFKHTLNTLGIKFKHIERTITHTYHHTYDTTITKLIEKPDGKKYFLKQFDPCLTVGGYIDFPTESIVFDHTVMSYKQQSYYYWQRKHKLFNLIPWGKKVNYVTTVNNCSGDTVKHKEINISKRRLK